MIITFKFIGLLFEADVVVEDDEYIVFESLTCEGRDASFLADSTLRVDLEDAAFDALAGMERQMAADVAADRAAERALEDELFSEGMP